MTRSEYFQDVDQERDEFEKSSLRTRKSKSESALQTPLETYLREINETSLLTAEEEQQLAVAIGNGDVRARDRMVRANLRLVVNIARGYAGKGLSLQDLIEEGNLGLLRAVEGFDPGMGTRFSTYASYWIKQQMATRQRPPDRRTRPHADTRRSRPRSGPAQKETAHHQESHPHL
jgi:RNA polymerase primary sigma factor